MKNKLLWGIVVALMLVELLAITVGYTTYPLSDYLYLNRGTMYAAMALPVLPCILIAITQRYKMLWIAIIPSLSQTVIFCVMASDMEQGILLLIFPFFKIISACAIVLLAHLFVLIVRLIRKRREGASPC